MKAANHGVRHLLKSQFDSIEGYPIYAAGCQAKLGRTYLNILNVPTFYAIQYGYGSYWRKEILTRMSEDKVIFLY